MAGLHRNVEEPNPEPGRRTIDRVRTRFHATAALARALPRRHLEREAERRIVLAGVIVVPGELRDTEIVRPRFLALVDARIEIDEVPAGLAGRLHDHLDVALAVEAAGIADIGVVVDHVHDVGGLGPTRALQVNPKLGAGWPAPDVERQSR